jgi:phosphoglycerol transferase
MKKYLVITFIISVITASLLSACGKNSQTQSVQNPLEPRYQASLSEGITFSKPGYPDFVSAVKGVSKQEDFGRWTDGTEAVIEFAQPLPKKFTLQITATIFPSTIMMGEPIKVVIGGTGYDAKFNPMWDFKEIEIPVTTDGKIKSISLLLPNAKSPLSLGQGNDTRKLCLALSSLKIIEN